MKNKVSKLAWRALGVLYFPIYLSAWLLHKIARILLAISYFGQLNIRMGKDILKCLFNYG